MHTSKRLRRYVCNLILYSQHSLIEPLQIGLIASPTPFATGRPHTLFSGKEIYSDGAVGIAICRYPKTFGAQKDLKITYEDLEPLGGPLEVTA